MSGGRRAARSVGLLLLVALLAACSSTTPMAQRPAEVVANEPTAVRATAEAATPLPSRATATEAAPNAPIASEPTATPEAVVEDAPTATPALDGPVTASMAQLQIGGERYSALGDPSAPVTLIEFSDFGCQFCRIHASMVFADLKAQYIDTGKIYYVFKDFPITESHPQAALAAEAAECAGTQGGYWPMHDQLFTDQSDWDGRSATTAQASFRRYAETIGLDTTAFDQCMTSQQFADEVQRDWSEARSLGLTGTPAFIINGKLMSGARPFEQFKQVLDKELAGS